RDLEGGRFPAERLARRGHFARAERLAVGLRRARARRRALADDRLAADEARLAGAARALDRLAHGLRIVAVDVRDHVPAVGLEAPWRVVAEPALHFAVNRDAVVVVERDQLPQSQAPGERARLVRDPFHETSVAHEDVRPVVDDGMAGTVEAGRRELLGDREAHRV